jgi:hypothetical protein
MSTIRQINAQWGRLLTNNAQTGKIFRKNDAQTGKNI